MNVKKSERQKTLEQWFPVAREQIEEILKRRER
jgi:hypothetical protein